MGVMLLEKSTTQNNLNPKALRRSLSFSNPKLTLVFDTQYQPKYCGVVTFKVEARVRTRNFAIIKITKQGQVYIQKGW